MSWTCKCCTVIFAERADFDKHKMECVKRATASTTCTKCGDVFVSVGFTAHLAESICGLRHYDVEDLYTWAADVNKKRVAVLVKEYHRNIMTAVANGRFSTRLSFMYADDDKTVRADAISKIVSELKRLFPNVDIKADHVGNFIDVSWNKTAVYTAVIRRSSADSDGTKSVVTTKEVLEDFTALWRAAAHDAVPEKGDDTPIGLKGYVRKPFTSKKIISLTQKYSDHDSIPEYDWTNAVKKQVPEATKRAIWEKYLGSKQQLPLSDDEDE